MTTRNRSTWIALAMFWIAMIVVDLFVGNTLLLVTSVAGAVLALVQLRWALRPD